MFKAVECHCTRHTKRGLRVSSTRKLRTHALVAFLRAEMLKAVTRRFVVLYQARLEQLKAIEC